MSTVQRSLESHFSEKSLTPQERKNLVEKVRYWTNETNHVRGLLTECEKKADRYGSQLSEYKSQVEKLERSVWDKQQDYDDMKKIQSEKDATIRELKQKCDSLENVN